MCSFLEFYYGSPDGMKALIVILPCLSLVTCVWLWTRRKPAALFVPMSKAECRAVAHEVVTLLRRGHFRAVVKDDTSYPPQLNPPEDRKEE